MAFNIAVEVCRKPYDFVVSRLLPILMCRFALFPLPSMRIARYFFRKAARIKRQVKLTAFAALVCTLSDGEELSRSVELAKSLHSRSRVLQSMNFGVTHYLLDKMHIRHNHDLEKYSPLLQSVTWIRKNSWNLYCSIERIKGCFFYEHGVPRELDSLKSKSLKERRKNREFWLGKRAQDNDNCGCGNGEAKCLKDTLDNYMKMLSVFQYAIENDIYPSNILDTSTYSRDLLKIYNRTLFDPIDKEPGFDHLTWEHYYFGNATVLENWIVLEKLMFDIIFEEHRLLWSIRFKYDKIEKGMPISAYQYQEAKFGSRYPYLL